MTGWLDWAEKSARWREQTRSVQLRLDIETFMELREHAKRHNTTVAETVREFITWGLEDAKCVADRGAQDEP